MGLKAVFKQLKDCPSGHAFTVATIPGCQNVLLGVDKAGHPVLFVQAKTMELEPSLRTDKVSLQIGQRYSLAAATGISRTETLNALYCESAEQTDIETFLVLAEAFVARYIGVLVHQDALTSFFRSMVRLFAVTPARNLWSEQLGLWGELFMMRLVRGFRFWVPFWHSESTQRFDFTHGRRRIEVKTTSGLERIHNFSHKQIYTIKGEEIFIASLVVSEDDSGLSLRQLILDCRSELLGMPDYLKLEKAVRRAGMEDSSETGPLFDASEAEASLAWFRSIDVPHFQIPEPAGVSETHYKVDLSTAPRVSALELDEWIQPWSLEPQAISIGNKYYC